jgi:hypothetical protein
MTRRISPLASGKVDITVVKASDRCRCDKRLTGAIAKVSPTCPVHGHGRPAGTGK